jgi:hypothetical protein
MKSVFGCMLPYTMGYVPFISVTGLADSIFIWWSCVCMFSLPAWFEVKALPDTVEFSDVCAFYC